MDLNSARFNRRTILTGALAAGGVAGLGGLLSGCGSSSDSGSTASVGTSLEEITTLAKQEGSLQLIAYPVTWANYGGHFKAFKAKYGINITVANPDGSSADELQAVKTLKGQKTAPDVLDIGYSFTQPAQQGGLIQQFKPSTFDKVPDNLKDPDGWWVAAYYGVLTIGANTKAVKSVPKTFADLLDPQYKGMITLSGDPRKAASAFATVVAAAIANGGSPDNIEPGIEYFAKMKKAGNLVNTPSVTSGLSTGQAKIALDWNYNFIGSLPELKKDGIDLAMNVPTDGVYGTYYAQPLTITPPQPNAGRLWIEWLTSEEGSEQYALGGAIPARYNELKAANKLSKAALANLPDADVLSKITFPTIAQGTAGGQVVAEQWGPKVANA